MRQAYFYVVGPIHDVGCVDRYIDLEASEGIIKLEQRNSRLGDDLATFVDDTIGKHAGGYP